MPLNDVPPPSKKRRMSMKPQEIRARKMRAEEKRARNSHGISANELAKREHNLQEKLRRTRVKKRQLQEAKQALDGESTKPLVIDELDQIPPNVKEGLEASEKVIFEPNEGPQTEFLAATEKEVFFGGARGGGKSYAMLVDPLRYCNNRHTRALLLRRTMPELRELIHKSHFLYPHAYKGAKWKEQDKMWRFPSGASIEFGYAENIQDAQRYLGQSYTWIGVDELPQFPNSDIWNFLRSSLRSVDPNLQTYMRATGNPGNVGSEWVREMFIEAAEWNTRFTIDILAETPKGPIRSSISRRFIPSSVFDNPYLTYDESYIAVLASLPETKRKQWLYGDWYAVEGAAFEEFDKNYHVCEPFEIPNEWIKFRGADWGWSSPACCLWFAVDFDGNMWVYRELYVNGKVSKRKYDSEAFAQKILDIEHEAGEVVRYGVLDSSAWARRGDTGPSIAEQMIRTGCSWRESDRRPNSRINGKLEVHRRLTLIEDHKDPEIKQPRMKIFNNCRNLIRTLPLLPLDENNPEDVDTDTEDHAYDALRYGCMSRPIGPNHLSGWRGPVITGDKAPVDPVFGY